MATASDLQQLYVGYFGRAADQEGLNFWLEAINNGGLSLENVHTSFVQSEEYTALYEGLSNSDLVTQVYLNVLGRAVEAEGLAFWAGALDAGTITQDQLIEGLLSGLSPADALIVQNKVTVANYYTTQVGASYGEADKTTSSDILKTVDGTLQSVSDALEDVAAVVPGGVPSALATALAQLEAAQNAQQAYATALQDDGTPGDDIAQVEALYGAAGTQLATDVAAYNAIATVDIASGDSAAIIAQKISESTAAAQKAVADAQTKLNVTVGPALVKSYNAALTNFNNADAAAAAALANQVGAKAKLESIDGGSYTINADGTATGLFVITNGQLVVDPAYTSANAGNQAALTAANELLGSVNARVAADNAEAAAKTALLAQATKVSAQDSTATFDADGKPTAGLLVDLTAAQKTQADLAKAVADLAETNKIVAEWADLADAVESAQDAITDAAPKGLGYNLESVSNGDSVVANGANDVFVFAENTFGNAAAIELDGDDVLFIGTGYTLGTDDAAQPGLNGGNNAALEVFFVLNNGVVEAHIETVEFGSNAATQETNVITLTGVTALDQVTFDANTGFISLA
ncbi:MAG TPA: hypothetical protein DCP33_19265 [Pseudomonas sp.]|nr:hypothetical protein [Pseudomonas sp.]